jgi:hypothetical protein
MPHCVTPTGPSMSLVPFWKRPWKWILVLWLPSYKVSALLRVLWHIHHLTWLCTLAVTRSPLVKLSKGSGHWPLIPMTGRSAMPSGLARTQVIFQSSVTVSAFIVMARAERHAKKHAIDQVMLLTAREYSVECEFCKTILEAMIVPFNCAVVDVMRKCKIDKMRSRSDKTSLQTSLLHLASVDLRHRGKRSCGSPRASRAHASSQESLFAPDRDRREEAKPQPSSMVVAWSEEAFDERLSGQRS